MKHIFPNRILTIAPALLALWLAISAIATTLIDSRTFVLSLALLALTSNVAIIGLFPFSAWIIAVFSILVYAAAQVALSTWSAEIFIPIAVNAIAFLITTWLGAIIYTRIKAVNRQIDHDHNIIDDLRIRDPQTGLMRYAYSQQTLRNEIGRSRRNSSSLCLILAQVVDWNELVSQEGLVASENIKIQIASVFKSTLRMIDASFIAGAYGAILPETKLDGALVVAKRIVDMVARKSQVDLRVGIAQFPTDGVTERELQTAAEAALQKALTSDHSILTYAQLKEGLAASEQSG